MKKNKITVAEIRDGEAKVNRERAMPDVKKLIKKHGIRALRSCILYIALYEKELNK